jgi:hypothetical protein
MGLTHSPKIVRDGLVLHLDAANVKSYPGSGSTWKDLSGYGNTGTLVNGASYSSENLGAIAVDGTNDYINTNFQATDYYSVSQGWTVISVHKITGSVGGNGRSGIFNNQRWYTETSPGGFGVGIINDTDYRPLLTYDVDGTAASYQGDTADISINFNNIECISYTWNPSNTTITGYKNGQSIVSTTDSSYKWSPVARNSRIGYNTQGGWAEYFPGSIYNIQVYNRSLSAAEIKQNFNAIRDRFGL